MEDEALKEGMKICRYCQRETGMESNFCWYCARELEPRPERPDVPASQSRIPAWVWIVISGAGLVGILVYAISRF